MKRKKLKHVLEKGNEKKEEKKLTRTSNSCGWNNLHPIPRD